MANILTNASNAIQDYTGLVPKGAFKDVLNLTSDFLDNSDFISRTIGTNKSYNDIMFMIQSMGREPISLLGKDYMFIYDHVRRNYLQGTQVENAEYRIPKFTFYKEKPTIRFANPYDDALNLKDKWFPNIKFEDTAQRYILKSYAESDDGYTNNRTIGSSRDDDNDLNNGVRFGNVESFANTLSTKDLIRKTNDNFNHGKYKTLIARFHTNSQDSKNPNDITQTAISREYGMSHGRNLLKKDDRTFVNGYDNPYCRVWTYHHQYDRVAKAIRPFIGGATSQDELEKKERGNYDTVGFRTKPIKSRVILDKEVLADNGESRESPFTGSENNFLGGSELLDKYSSLNFKTGFVNIAPTAKIKDYFDGMEDSNSRMAVSVKKCMFSIENLAWRTSITKNNEFNPTGLSPEQRGPLGGRIMWFPPYNINFNEESRVDWNANQFIGRGEKIYTYTNTERTGTLSFTLLIDHPSIIDYWDKDWLPGNGGGVDEKGNQENTLLRFFAGCDVLSAKPQKYFKRVNPPEEPTNDEGVTQTPPETDVTDTNPTHTVSCILYFPNNYSGVDDFPTVKDSTFNAIYYLMNGFGTGKFINTKNGKDCFKPIDGATLIDRPVSDYIYECDVTNNTTSCYDKHQSNNCTEYPCQENGLVTNPKKVDDFSGGYEVYFNKKRGISVSNELIDEANTSKTYACTRSGERGRFITNGNGSKRYAYKVSEQDPDTDIFLNYLELAKINGPSLRYSWCYRIDNAYYMQKLSTDPTSYLDLKSFGYNGQNFSSARTINEFDIKEDSSEYKLISFVDMFCALEKDQKCLTPISQENVKTINDIMTNDSYKVKRIRFRGHASKQGHNPLNDDLANHRAETLKQWLIEKGFPGAENGKVEDPIKQDYKSNPNMGEDNSELPKLWRSAEVIIEYTIENVENIQTSQPSSDERINISLKGMKGVSISETSKPTIVDPNDYELVFDDNLKSSTRIKETDSIDESVKKDELVDDTRTVNRYDNEGEFFELLEKDHPFMHHLISEKIRYFDPAFHSISPEGFNARLTFLHQCTRQGSTAENAHFETSVAYNLAFGRPPVCVLRLGDFYNTKIIINSLSIQYENPTWDLNPEGIGVMPMFANVTLSFAFIGGSDLAGPIARLQNAVSFNYYANTSVYDNRADRVEYDPNKSGKEIKLHTNDYTK